MAVQYKKIPVECGDFFIKLKYFFFRKGEDYCRKLIKTPAAIAEPITPETFADIAY